MPPHILIVPGSFCPPNLYEPIRDALVSLGISASLLGLRTVQPTHPVSFRLHPAPSMYDDARAIASEVRRLKAEGKDQVWVLGHSYCGAPLSQAFDRRTGAEAREHGQDAEIDGLSGSDVEGIIYLAAVPPPLGSSTNSDLFGGDYTVDELKTMGAGYSIVGSIQWQPDGYMHQIPEIVHTVAFSQWIKEGRVDQSINYVRAHFGAHSARSFHDKLTYPGYADVANAGRRVVWIRTGEDLIVKPEKQDGYIANINAEIEKRWEKDGAALKVEVFELKEADHCPNVTATEDLAGTIKKILLG